MANDAEQGFALERIVLSPDAATAFHGIADTATLVDRGLAFASPVEELRAFDLVQCIEIGPAWYLSRTPRGRAWARLRAA